MSETRSDQGDALAVNAVARDWASDILSGRLPLPLHERWQPQRAGLVNIFLFEDERFPFADGRLLLRGINATGKSRVLAFLLPFLLDADLRPTRLEPDRDATRQVAWNLLMGEHHDRLGYSWMEFGRVDPVEGPQYLTLGCGLRAVQDRGIVDHWFFMTSRRIDADFALITPQRTALTKRQLAETLGEAGQVFDRASDYRRAVDEKLFRLGDRYEHLMELLLSLRQPQLAKRLELDQLELALQNSLPPLAENLLATAAEAFRSLDADRRQLQASRQALAQTEAFLIPYRQHVRIGLLRAAATVRKAQRGYENASRNLRDIEQQIEQLTIEAQQHDAARLQAEAEVLATEATMSALLQSDAARSAERLTEKSETLKRARDALLKLEESHQRASVAAEAAQQRVKNVEQRTVDQRRRAREQSNHAAALAAPESLAREHQEQVSMLCDEQALHQPQIAAALAALRDHAQRWQRHAQHLCSANDAIAAQQELWQEQKLALNACEADLHKRRAAAAEAAEKVTLARSALWASIEQWFREAAQLFADVSLLAEVERKWTTWAEDLIGNDPLVAAVDDAYRQKMAELAARAASIEQERTVLAARRCELIEQQQRIESGEELVPAAPPTRNPNARSARQGAPLWRLIDFAPSVPQAEHASWEAALQASGILDAWLQPDGRLANIDGDTLLFVDGETLPHERQLARVFQPMAPDSPPDVSREIVMAILERIGVGEGAGRIWVDHSGRWQNGPLAGQWTKQDAEFIGDDARRRHRQRRMQQLAAELAACDQQDQRWQTDSADIERAQSQLEVQRQSLPSSDSLRRSLTTWETCQQHAAEAQLAYLAATERERVERERHSSLITERDRDAQDMGLASWAQRPHELISQLQQYVGALQIVERDLIDIVSSLDDHTQADAARAQADASLAIAQENLRMATSDVLQQQVELKTLTQTLGVAAAEITAKIDNEKQKLHDAKKRHQQHLQVHAAAQGRAASQQSLIATRESEIQQCDEQRREAVASLQQRAELGLIEVAEFDVTAPASPWNLTQGVEVARLLHRASDEQPHDDEAWSRSQARIHDQRETLRSHLSSYDLTPEPEFLVDGLQLVHVPFRGTVLRIDEVARQLGEETAAHERVLSERERQIFEDFLLGEVGLELHRRMYEAAEQIERMNSEVESRPMSTGMQMRFRWDLADDASGELHAARDVLMRLRETWSSDERAALTAFLQKRIQEQQLRDAAATWQSHLEAALDYRRWHALRIERRADPQQPWRLLSRRTYGALSGGEKAIALTIPQCAAASAYYSSADRHAPRLILLDEAFAGVSTDNRSSCLELLVSFDLDVVMTSENERGCYPAVPGLAICRLSRAPDLPVVLNDVFVWNGKRQQGPAEPALPADELPLFAAATADAAAHTNGDLA